MSNDVIHIKDLKLHTVIGVLPHEKTTPQPIHLDIDLFVNINAAGRSDQLSDAVNYADVVAFIKDLLPKQKVELIEALATNIADNILKNFAVSKVRLSLFKPQAILEARTVGVTIERTR